MQKVTDTITEACGASRSEIAKRLGITTAAVQNWDRTGKLPPLRAIELHRAFGADLAVLESLISNR